MAHLPGTKCRRLAGFSGFLALLIVCVGAAGAGRAAPGAAPVRVDEQQAAQDITQFLTPILTPKATDDDGHIAAPEPRALAMDDAFAGWSAITLENRSQHPVTRVLVFSYPALARSGAFGASFAHPRVTDVRAVEGDRPVEEALSHVNNRYAVLRVTLPPNSLRTFAFLTEDGARATTVRAWDPQSLSRFDSFLLITIGLFWGMLFVGAALMFALRLLAGGPGLSAGGTFAIATLAFEATCFSAGASLAAPWFVHLTTAGTARAITLVLVCALGLAFLRQILMLRDESPISDLLVRIVQYALLIAIPLTFWSSGPLAAHIAVAVTLLTSGAAIWHARRMIPDALQLVSPGWWLIAFAAAAAFTVGATGYSGGGPLTEILLHGAFVVGVTILLFSAAVPATLSTGVLEYTAPQSPQHQAFARDGSDLPAPPSASLPVKRSASGEGSYQGLWDWSIAEDRLYISPSIERMMGLPEGAIKGKERYWIARIVEEDRKVYVDTFHYYIEQGSSSFALEFRVHHEDGGIRWLQLRATGLAGEGGRASRIIGIVTDITAAKVAEQKLVHDASHDALTGIGNRTFMISHLEWAIGGRREHPATDPRTGQVLNPVLILLDIDRFKWINSEFGRAAGDRLLKQIARSIERSLGANDFVARIGADEFAILLTPRAGDANRLPAMKDPREMVKLLGKALAEPLELGEEMLNPSAAFACVEIDEQFAQAGEALAQAEYALRRARGHEEPEAPPSPRALAPPCLLPVKPERSAEDQESDLLAADLRSAIQRDQMSILFQPILSLADRSLAGFEAVMCWQHPQRGMIAPEKFMPIAEAAGLAATLRRFELSMAAMQLAQWQSYFPLRRPLFVSVNVSSRQLLGAEFGRDVSSVLNTLKLAPHSLRLALPEALAREDQAQLSQLLSAIKSDAISIQLNGYGRSDSTLARLKTLPLAAIELDAAQNQRFDASTLRASLSAAREARLQMIGRGVTSEAEAQALVKLGCDLGQGSFFGVAMNASEAQRFIAMHWKVEAPARAKTA